MQTQRVNVDLNLEEDFDDLEREKIRKQLLLMIKLGLTQTWAYHCLRCNYLWFPKDFDAFTYNTAFGGRNIFFRKSPKSCARCKSKYWKSLPKRKTKHTPDPKKGVYGHDMLTIKRIRAEQREIIRCLAELDKREKFLDDYCKKRNIVLDNINFDKDEKEKKKDN